jgi:hypothetical protein
MRLMGSPKEHFLRFLRLLRNLSLEIVRYRRVAGSGTPVREARVAIGYAPSAPLNRT